MTASVGGPILWRGRPEASMVWRRRLLAAIQAIAWSAAAALTVTAGFWVMGARAELVALLVFMLVVTVAPTVVRHARATVAATRAARETEIELTETSLVVERGGQRHERRLATLPPVRLRMESAGVGSVVYEAPRPSIPVWLMNLYPGPEGHLLVESVPDAQRLYALLDHYTSIAHTEAPTVGTSDPDEPTRALGRPVPRARTAPSVPLGTRMLRGLARFPWWIGIPFFGFGAISLFQTLTWLSALWSFAPWFALLMLAIPVGLTAFGGGVILARTRKTLTGRRLQSSGLPAMAEVVELADANFELNGVEQRVVRYRYRVGGLEFTGESPMMSPERVRHWAAGDRVGIAYDPRDPSVSTWLGDDLVPEAG